MSDQHSNLPKHCGNTRCTGCNNRVINSNIASSQRTQRTENERRQSNIDIIGQETPRQRALEQLAKVEVRAKEQIERKMVDWQDKLRSAVEHVLNNLHVSGHIKDNMLGDMLQEWGRERMGWTDGLFTSRSDQVVNKDQGSQPPRCGSRSDCKNAATEPHSCPYKEDINNDYESLCECCDDCYRECVDDI